MTSAFPRIASAQQSYRAETSTQRLASSSHFDGAGRGGGAGAGGGGTSGPAVDASRLLPSNIRAILLTSPVRTAGHAPPEKCYVRTSDRISTVSSEQLILLKGKRRQEILESACHSSGLGKPYRELGAPTLDLLTLVYQGCQIPVARGPEVAKSKLEAYLATQKETVTKSGRPSTKAGSHAVQSHQTQRQATADHTLLRSEIDRARNRTKAVMFGKAFTEVLEAECGEREEVDETTQLTPTPSHGVIDWTHLKINKKKITEYLESTIERATQRDKNISKDIEEDTDELIPLSLSKKLRVHESLRSENMRESILEPMAPVSASIAGGLSSEGETAPNARPPSAQRAARAASAAAAARQASAELSRSGMKSGVVTDQDLGLPDAVTTVGSGEKKHKIPSALTHESELSVNSKKAAKVGTARKRQKALEELPMSLEINQIKLIDKYCDTRAQFHERQQRITEGLDFELRRHAMERLENFERKFRNFEMSERSDFRKDVRVMRARSAVDRTRKIQERIQEHPWYNELRALYPDTLISSMSDEFQTLIYRIRSYVELGVPFDKPVIVDLMKAIPHECFGEQDLQRVLRFVKSKERIRDKDFFDAVEAAGQSLESLKIVGSAGA